MFKDLIYNIVITISVTLIIALFKKIVIYLNSEPNKVNRVNLPATRKQFFISLITLIISLSSFFTIENLFSKYFFAIISFFAFIIVWGAFDAVYYFVKASHNDNSQNVSDETSYNIK